MAQFILDQYPDAISEFGLLGCGWTTITAAIVVWCLFETIRYFGSN